MKTPSQRYHVTPNGDWSACHAKSPASCPYGGPDGANHYDSKSQAITAAEAIVKQNSEHKPLVGKNGGRKPTTKTECSPSPTGVYRRRPNRIVPDITGIR